MMSWYVVNVILKTASYGIPWPCITPLHGSLGHVLHRLLNLRAPLQLVDSRCPGRGLERASECLAASAQDGSWGAGGGGDYHRPLGG